MASYLLRSLSRSFASGEVTQELFGHIDLAKYQTGLAACRNFITLPHGPAVNRPGFMMVHETKNSAVASRLIPFSYSNTQTFAIEMGAGYFRFHTQGAVLLAGTPSAYAGGTAYAIGDMCLYSGRNYYCIAASTGNLPTNTTYWYAMPTTGEYEIPNPYAASDLFDIHYVQSADVLTLVHPSYPVRELRRYGATNWQLYAPTFKAPDCVLTGVSASATGTGSISYQYCVTTVANTGLEESVASAVTTAITNNLATAGNKNTITWTDPSTAGTNIRYNIYKKANGLYGYIGQASGTSFEDNNITADVTYTPPINEPNFNDATGNYPSAVSYYEQRRCFGGTTNKPQNVWMTRSATESNMSYTIPSVADNRIAFRIAAREASKVQHLIPVANLIALTPSCEWKITSADSSALSPSNISVKPQSYNGANNVTPVVVGNSVIYGAAFGGHVREMSYSWQANGYQSGDLCLLAPHLFDYYQTTDMTYQKSPYPILWTVSTSGNLLGMTYVPEQQVAGWHRHDTTNGTFESVCCITESNQSYLYAIIKRTFNGVTKRFVERMESRYFDTVADTFFVDCGAKYNGAPVTTISGLTWLEGQTVSILADGAVIPQQVVTGGAITLPYAASKVTVGLPITADLQTLPLAVQIDGAFGQGRMMNVNAVYMRLVRSSGVLAGPDFNTLTAYKQRTTEPYGTPPNPVSGEIKIPISASWDNNGQVCVRQSDPLPLDISSMTIEVAPGG